jgi:hypothetical protein
MMNITIDPRVEIDKNNKEPGGDRPKDRYGKAGAKHSGSFSKQRSKR